jgi:hypothetical protein
MKRLLMFVAGVAASVLALLVTKYSYEYYRPNYKK